jgi:dynein heavy chain
MNSFWYFFTTKAKHCENDIIRLNKVLETLNQTREGSRQMRNYIKDLRVRCKQAEQDSEQSLKTLIEKTTAVEKLKAKIGLGGSLAALMQMQEDTENESSNLFEDNRLLNEDNNDEYDKEFNRMREESFKNKQQKMAEEHERAKQTVEESKRLMTDKKKQVEHWRNKVDRTCIEKIRAFQSPPILIGQIMEMVIVMIGKKKFPEIFKNPASASVLQEKDETVASVDGVPNKPNKPAKTSITYQPTRYFLSIKKILNLIHVF